jgi:hypothetical protein
MTYYQLDTDKLQPGDVILEAGSGLISNAIKLLDGGALTAFSHVFLYVGMNLIMEADEDVRSILASRVITETPDSYLVLRHPDFAQAISNPVWKSFTGNLAFLVMHPEVNKPYNWRGMFNTKLGFLGNSSNGFFCSQLVVEAYRRVGVPAFKSDLHPEQVTPNKFVSPDCLLTPVADCFLKLPDRDWISEFAGNRYDVMKNEPTPLAQMTYEITKDMVRLFGPRVDKLTASINKKQTITSPMDLYLTLTYPDLPEADAVSDDLVKFMELRYPSGQIKSVIEVAKASCEEAVSWKLPDITEMIKRSLRKDIATIGPMLQLMEKQVRQMRSFPPPPMKRRSIHNWIAKKTDASIRIETEFLEWRKDMLDRISIA